MASNQQAGAPTGANPAAVLNEANLHFESGAFDEAVAGYLRAITLKPDFVDAHSNLGNVLRRQGRVEEAIAACRRAIALKPDFAPAHLNLALALLLNGDFDEGWREYEWRWQGGAKDLKPRDLRRPRWRGEDLRGKTLLLHAEQGLGDTLQFARFAPVMATRGAKVILAVQPPLVALLREAQWPNVKVNDGARLSGFDFELPLMSVPAVVGMTEKTIPPIVPYLATDPDRTAVWRKRLPNDRYKIGIVWQGRPEAKIDPRRSFPLQSCAPLCRIKGVSVISLQKGHGLDQLDALPPDMNIERLDPDFDNGPGAFLDSAAIMMSLDLVITADTATAHLAGALARPVWIALPQVAEWRWLMRRDDTPWYPTARLFRQGGAADWHEVFARMARELAPLSAAKPQ
jgi:tetratricopeptide repeat protein